MGLYLGGKVLLDAGRSNTSLGNVMKCEISEKGKQGEDTRTI